MAKYVLVSLFSTLKNISSKILTQQLNFMQKMGLISRKSYPAIPPKVEYSLTELGKRLNTVLKVLQTLDNEYRFLIS